MPGFVVGLYAKDGGSTRHLSVRYHDRVRRCTCGSLFRVFLDVPSEVSI
jgi:hypothetical protein